MSKDYEQISGNENMSDTDKSYFEHFGDEMYDQVEVVLGRHNLDIETMKDECVCFMNTLAGNPFEYLVEGAPLVCSMQTDEEQILRDGDGKIASNPELGYIKDISKLRITDDRRVTFAEYTPATVKDTKGGLRDVEKGLNIVSFGNCQCIKKKDLKLLARELRTDTKIEGVEEKMRNAILDRKGTCYCYMKLNPEWENLPLGYDFETESYVGNSNSASNVLNSFSAGISQALYNTYQMFNGEQGINMMSILFCQRGGIITPWDSGQKRTGQERRTPSLILDGWLTLYDSPTVNAVGRSEPRHDGAKLRDWAMPEDLGDGDDKKSEDWFETSSPAHDEIVINKKGNFEVQKTSNNLYIDGEGRYWVSVGPNVVNPNHSTKKTDHDIDSSEVNYGTKLDIVVKRVEDGKIFYIPAVNGDTKEHSYPDGLYQTGEPFNETRPMGSTEDRNTVEFIGYEVTKIPDDKGGEKHSTNITNDYELIEIIVYDETYNYE